MVSHWLSQPTIQKRTKLENHLNILANRPAEKPEKSSKNKKATEVDTLFYYNLDLKFI